MESGIVPLPIGCMEENTHWLRRSLQLEAKISRVGVSLIHEEPKPVELHNLALELSRVDLKRRATGLMQLQLAVSEILVEGQLPDRVDATAREPRRGTSGTSSRTRP